MTFLRLPLTLAGTIRPGYSGGVPVLSLRRKPVARAHRVSFSQHIGGCNAGHRSRARRQITLCFAGKRSRALACTCGEITTFRRQPNRKLFRQPRPWCRLGEQNDPMVQQSLLDAGVIRGAGGPPVVLALPEADRAFINAQCRPKRPLGQPSQNRGGAELAPRDKFLALSGHGNLCLLVTRHMPPPRWRSRSA